MKKQIKMFVSYAHANRPLADRFMKQFIDYVKPSKRFDYLIWRDVEIKTGEIYKEIIIKELEECDCGLLLISTSFLNSDFIDTVELPALLNHKKAIFPVLLSKVDLNLHDLKGLHERQIFRFIDDNFKDYRSYSELKQKRRLDFIAKLFVDIEDRLQYLID